MYTVFENKVSLNHGLGELTSVERYISVHEKKKYKETESAVSFKMLCYCFQMILVLRSY